MGDSAIADLLEREEKKALERFEKEKKAKESDSAFQRGGDNSTPDNNRDRAARPSSSRRRDDDNNDDCDDDRGDPVRPRDPAARRPRDSHDRYLSEREENDERRSRRSRDIADEDAARGGSDKDSANGSVRSSYRTRSPLRDRDRDRDHSHRHHSHRSSGNGGGGDYYRRDDHYRPDPSSRDRDRDRDRERDRDRDRRPRSRSPPRRGDRRGYRDPPAPPRRHSRDRGGPRGGHSPGRKKADPEASTDERDKRTVFVQQLAARLRSRQLEDFFSQAGEVVEAQIVKDRVSQRSKGVGYVEFKDEESVQKAIALTGQKLLGIPIIAQLTEAEKNRQVRQTESGGSHASGAPFHRLYVGNIHFSISEEDLRGVFESFGELDFVQLQKDEAGRSKGFGFVQFVDPTEAKQALDAMNGFELAGRPIRVGLGNERFTSDSTNKAGAQFNSQTSGGQAAQTQGSSFSGMGGRGTHAGGTGNFDRAGGRDGDKFAGASALDDSDVSGVQFSNVDRFALMSKLARTEDSSAAAAAANAAPVKAQARKPEIEHPAATRCVVLKNLYDPAENTGAAWQQELVREVQAECEHQFGKIVHIALGLDSDEGEVYIKFATVRSGEMAIQGLNGRWFAGRSITAQYVIDAVYHIKWPKAAALN